MSSFTRDIEWANLPKSILPSPEEFYPVEQFVADAISSRHATEENPVAESSSKAYWVILDMLKKKDDLQMMVKILLALRTSGNGTTLGKISRENEKHSRLIHSLFRFDPFDSKVVEETKDWPEPYSLVDAHLNLVLTLVSANSTLLLPAINLLWKLILRTPAITPDDDIKKEASDNDGKVEETDDVKAKEAIQMNTRLHGTLSKILWLVPKGKSEIFSVIASFYPHKVKALESQRNYVKQCLILLRYVPTIHQQLLELLLDKSLEIDVEIKVANNGNVEVEEAENDEANTSMETDAKVALNESFDALTSAIDLHQKQTDELEKLQKEKKAEMAAIEMAEKLDSNMLLMFEHLDSSMPRFTPRQLFNMIIPSFDSIVLTTHRSKFVQFVILYLCGKDSEIPIDLKRNEDPEGQSHLFRAFAVRLIEFVLDNHRATVIRQSATCYLASFVSRACYVCPETACESVVALLRYAEAYMDCFPTEASARMKRGSASNDTRSAEKDRVDMHSLFYTVCQAAFYIMCFRGIECINHYESAVRYYAKLDDASMESDDATLLFCDPSHLNISKERWTRLCTHHLQPLRYCLESVRGEFLLLADAYNLIESDVLEKLIVEDRKMASGIGRKSTNRKPIGRKKASAIQTPAMLALKKKRINGGVGGLGRGMNPLDSFFPFDPYLLRESFQYVEPFYRQWEGNNFEREKVSEDTTDPVVDMDIVGEGDDKSVNSNDDASEASESQCTMESDEDDDSISSVKEPASDNESSLPVGIYVQELKRARALSISDDYW